jgi:hypothetical protein
MTPRPRPDRYDRAFAHLDLVRRALAAVRTCERRARQGRGGDLQRLALAAQALEAEHEAAAAALSVELAARRP